MRALVLIVVVLASACVAPTVSGGDAAPAAPTPISTSSDLPPVASEVVDLTNAERLRAGLNALTVNARLTYAAQLQADQCARLGRIDHVLPEAPYPRPEDRITASGYEWRAYGENLAMGYPRAADAVQGWMESPDHRANLLSSVFAEIGVAYTVDSAGRTYYVQVFGNPR
jgi:uncharacterized protein YkwD